MSDHQSFDPSLLLVSQESPSLSQATLSSDSSSPVFACYGALQPLLTSKDGVLRRMATEWLGTSLDEIVTEMRTALERQRQRTAILLEKLERARKKGESLEAILADCSEASCCERKTSASSSELGWDWPEVSGEAAKYPPHIRQQKIERYRQKREQRKQVACVSRHFKGRSAAARVRPRSCGKFRSTADS